jgi:hypothetical protein
MSKLELTEEMLINTIEEGEGHGLDGVTMCSTEYVVAMAKLALQQLRNDQECKNDVQRDD